MSKERLLAAVEELLRTMPAAEELASGTDEVLAWRGQAAAVVTAWSIAAGQLLRNHLIRIDDAFDPNDAQTSSRDIRELLFQARLALTLESPTATSVAIRSGAVFQYFSELTSKLKLASQDVLFADPYLNPEFVQRYLPQISAGVTVRLLSKRHLPQLLPAVELFAKQHGTSILVREADFHDRHVFIDGRIGYQSGASFKDGAANAPTGLIEIVDVFAATYAEYEKLWSGATVHR